MTTATGAAGDAGAFLSLEGLSARSEHRLSLGALGCERFTAGARTKRWWMGPAFGTRGEQVPAETQFVLCELADGAYAVLMPLVRAPLRATLDGSKTSSAADLQLVLQSGDGAVRFGEMEDAL